jgi:hypothetical protein
MRKLILYILLLCFSTASAQVDYFTIPKGDGTLIGMVEHVAPLNPAGKKAGVILWLHGIDGNSRAPVNANDTTRIDNVTNKGPLRNVRGGSPLPRYQKPGTTGAENTHGWSIVGPQNRPTCSPCTPNIPNDFWKCDIVAAAIDYIRDNPQKWDTSLIVLWGYSLGGRGIKSCLTNSGVLPYVKYVVDIAGGTFVVGSTTTTPIANANIPMDVFLTVNDELVTNFSNTDQMINGIKAADPGVIPNYIRLQDITQSTTNPSGEFMAHPEHDFMEFLIARDTTNGDTETMTNGSTWTKNNDTNIYIRGLRFFGPRKQSLPYLFIFSLIPLRRRKKEQTLKG